MEYAKVNKTVVVKYPYTMTDLEDENGSTSYDDRFSLDGWYGGTSEALAMGFTVVEVMETPAPSATDSDVSEGMPAIDVDGTWKQVWVVSKHDAVTIANNKRSLKETIRASIISATKKSLDDFAKERNYESILSLCTYVTSSIPKFALEGARGLAVRDATWSALYEIEKEIVAGTRPEPASFADIAKALPVLIW